MQHSIISPSLYFASGLGDTDDTTMCRDTEFPRYWYRHDDDTFWYRDTTNIAVLLTIISLSRPAETFFCLLHEYFYSFRSKNSLSLNLIALLSAQCISLPFHSTMFISVFIVTSTSHPFSTSTSGVRDSVDCRT